MTGPRRPARFPSVHDARPRDPHPARAARARDGQRRHGARTPRAPRSLVGAWPVGMPRVRCTARSARSRPAPLLHRQPRPLPSLRRPHRVALPDHGGVVRAVGRAALPHPGAHARLSVPRAVGLLAHRANVDRYRFPAPARCAHVPRHASGARGRAAMAAGRAACAARRRGGERVAVAPGVGMGALSQDGGLGRRRHQARRHVRRRAGMEAQPAHRDDRRPRGFAVGRRADRPRRGQRQDRAPVRHAPRPRRDGGVAVGRGLEERLPRALRRRLSAVGRSATAAAAGNRRAPSCARCRAPPIVRGMHGIALVVGVVLIAWVLWDAFETILLPRRVPARLRLSRFFLRWLWTPWSAIALAIRHRPRRENFLGFYALLSILSLLAAWAAGLVAGFALVLWSEGSRIAADGEQARFALDLYLSGTTFFTLGLGDVRPMTGLARLAVVIEAGMGFGFLALVISYLPVLYQAFSKREGRITMLDEWAGSPP